VAAIEASIRQFGFNSVLAVYDGQVMVGNHRFLALQAMKSKGEAPPKGITATKAGWSVPVVKIDHLTEEEAIAYAIADNKTSSLATPNDQLLAELMSEIQDADILAATGFQLSEIDDLLAELEQKPSAPEPKAETTRPLPSLRWDRNSCALTEEEATELTRRYEKHIDQFGTPFGFVKALLGI
jgi:hypothetical protein